MFLSCRGLRSRALATLIALVCVFGSQAGFAAGLPSSVLQASGSLSSGQLQTVQQYVSPLVKQLGSGDVSEVVKARAALLSPLRDSAATDDFKADYSQLLLKPLSQTLSSGPLIVRLNAMIVIAHLRGSDLLGPAATALQDKSPAVRYWGAKAIKQAVIESGASMSQSQSQQVNKLLSSAVSEEQSPAVLEQVFLTMVVTGRRHDHKMLYTALRSRLAYHANHPEASYIAEHTAMQSLFVRLVKANAQGESVGASAKQMASVAVRYDVLLAAQLEAEKNLSHDEVTNRKHFIHFCDDTLRYVVSQVLNPGNARTPALIARALRSEDWASVAKVAAAWQKLLQGSPYNLTAAQTDQATQPTGSTQPSPAPSLPATPPAKPTQSTP